MAFPVRSTLGFTLGLWSMLWLATPPVCALDGPTAGLLARVNQIRGADHLVELRHSDALAEVATAHARDMARHGYLDHIDRDGHSPLARVQRAGIEGFALLAENIGASDATQDRVEAIVTAWLRSPVHRENLFNPAFNTTGVGFATGRSGQTIIVQLFATF